MTDRPTWRDELILGVAIACCVLGLLGVITLAVGWL